MRLESTKFTIKRKDSKSKRESCTQSARPGASVNYMKLKASTGSLSSGCHWQTPHCQWQAVGNICHCQWHSLSITAFVVYAEKFSNRAVFSLLCIFLLLFLPPSYASDAHKVRLCGRGTECEETKNNARDSSVG